MPRASARPGTSSRTATPRAAQSNPPAKAAMPSKAARTTNADRKSKSAALPPSVRRPNDARPSQASRPSTSARRSKASRPSNASREALPKLAFRPLTPDRWKDVVALFGPRGACAGCWCMWWRLGASDFRRLRGEGNKRAFRRVASEAPPPGVLAYSDDAAVGWCAIAPRAAYTRLTRSRIFRPIDAEPVWSVSCFFVAKPYRRRGATVALLRAAVLFAKAHGARIVEGYPVEPRKGSLPDPFAWTGFASAFRAAGFVEAARRSETRPMMRIRL